MSEAQSGAVAGCFGLAYPLSPCSFKGEGGRTAAVESSNSVGAIGDDEDERGELACYGLLDADEDGFPDDISQLEPTFCTDEDKERLLSPATVPAAWHVFTPPTSSAFSWQHHQQQQQQQLNYYGLPPPPPYQQRPTLQHAGQQFQQQQQLFLPMQMNNSSPTDSSAAGSDESDDYVSQLQHTIHLLLLLLLLVSHVHCQPPCPAVTHIRGGEVTNGCGCGQPVPAHCDPIYGEGKGGDGNHVCDQHTIGEIGICQQDDDGKNVVNCCMKLPDPPPTPEPCPFDCSKAEWGEWNVCSPACGMGAVRKRFGREHPECVDEQPCTGLPSCDRGSRQCVWSNDPHWYQQFDGRPATGVLEYQSNCDIVLSQPCKKNVWPDNFFPKFKIIAHQSPCGGRKSSGIGPTCIQGVTVEFDNGDEFSTKGGLKRNGQTVADAAMVFPVEGPPNVKVRFETGYIVVMDELDTEIFRAKGGRVILKDPFASMTAGHLCGLCGQHDYVAGDDSRFPDGTLSKVGKSPGSYHTYAEKKFYDEYMIKDQPQGCSADPRWNGKVPWPATLGGGDRKKRAAGEEQELVANCKTNRRYLRKVEKSCSLIKMKRRSPFGKCNKNKDLVDVDVFYETCVHDGCIEHQFAYDILTAFAQICGQANVVKDWRQRAGFPRLSCPKGSRYGFGWKQSCVKTCYNPLGECSISVDKEPFVEGCVCNGHLARHGDGCIGADKCPPDSPAIVGRDPRAFSDEMCEHEVDVHAKKCLSKRSSAMKLSCLTRANVGKVKRCKKGNRRLRRRCVRAAIKEKLECRAKSPAILKLARRNKRNKNKSASHERD